VQCLDLCLRRRPAPHSARRPAHPRQAHRPASRPRVHRQARRTSARRPQVLARLCCGRQRSPCGTASVLAFSPVGWPAHARTPLNMLYNCSCNRGVLAGPGCVGQQDGFFWPDVSSAYLVDANVTTMEGCCSLCIVSLQCQRFQVTPLGCSLLDTANATSPFDATSASGVGLGEQHLPAIGHAHQDCRSKVSWSLPPLATPPLMSPSTVTGPPSPPPPPPSPSSPSPPSPSPPPSPQPSVPPIPPPPGATRASPSRSLPALRAPTRWEGLRLETRLLPTAGLSCNAFPSTFWGDEESYFVENTTIASAADCCVLCLDTSTCVRYQFIGFGVASAACYLKNDTYATDPDAAATSTTAGNGERAAGARSLASCSGGLDCRHPRCHSHGCARPLPRLQSRAQRRRRHRPVRRRQPRHLQVPLSTSPNKSPAASACFPQPSRQTGPSSVVC
jgi:hypothetical protein